MLILSLPPYLFRGEPCLVAGVIRLPRLALLAQPGLLLGSACLPFLFRVVRRISFVIRLMCTCLGFLFLFLL